jgi:glycosyltransferase involved in cell wall biosynthesis
VHVILDVSRLLHSVSRNTPSGIDRVEFAYARHWLLRPAHDSTFVAQSIWGWFAAVPRERVLAFIDALGGAWRGGPGAPAAHRRAIGIAAHLRTALAGGLGRTGLATVLERHRARCVFLLVSHRSLDRPQPIAGIRRAGAAFVPMLHDMIPLTHPEYTRPGQVARHARRVATTAALADGVLANSAATATALDMRMSGARRRAPLAVAPLGIETLCAATSEANASGVPAADGCGGLKEAPYFLCLGTIEPRKNHLMLLHVWRSLAEQGGAAPPRLLLVGRRGWENEHVFDLLDRCAVLRGGLVEERGALPDAMLGPVLAGARALLFPSFAEGFGLPVAEALLAGVPVICSDLPSLREIAADVPERLDPMDGVAWRSAIQHYTDRGSARREAQLRRMRSWRAPGWQTHFELVDGVLDRAVRARAAAEWSPARGRAVQGGMVPARLSAHPGLAVTADSISA